MEQLLSVTVLLCLSAGVAGFATDSMVQTVLHPTRSSCCHYRESLSKLYYSGEDTPPFSEWESAQARVRRMEMARNLQKVFYKDPPKSSASSAATFSSSSPSTTSSLVTPSNQNNNAPYSSTALRNLPTITSNDGIKSGGANKSALLPGHQFVWNIYNPQHIHMFHSILSGPAPWFFAHVHIPSSATTAHHNDNDSDNGENGEEEEEFIDNVQRYKDIQYELKSDRPLYGTLLRITDRRFQDEDGRIVLAVQAVDRVRVHSVASLTGTSLCTDVQISPEQELLRSYFDRALLSSASYLSAHADDSDDGGSREALSCPSAISGAARAAAAADTARVRKFEFLPIFLEEKPKRPSSATSLRSSPNDSNATKKIKDAIRGQEKAAEEKGPEYVKVVQLANYDVFGYSSMENTDSVTTHALNTYWEQLGKESAVEEVDLFGSHHGSSDSSSSSFFLPEPSPPSFSSGGSTVASAEKIEMLEFHVWRTLDELFRLLSLATSATVPVPPQLLGLLPKRDDWPHQFALEAYAKSMSTSGNTVGAAFSSPFVRVDYMTSSNPNCYSSLRRASRLSYAIWLLLDGFTVTGAVPQPLPRHEILQMDSIEERLDAAKAVLDGVNLVLKKMIQENQKDGDNKK